MARITVTTDQGVLIEVIDAEDIGDLDKPLARQALIETIANAVAHAHAEEG